MKGWVYVITNKGHDGLVKIGHTTRTPEERASEMTGTHSPFPYLVEYKIRVEDSFAVERAVHKAIDHLHVGERHRNGAGVGGVGVEWFRIPLEDAIAAVKNVAVKSAILDQPEAGNSPKAMTSAKYKSVNLSQIRAEAEAAERKQRGIELAERQIMHAYRDRFDAVTKTPYWPYFIGGFVLSAILAEMFIAHPTGTQEIVWGAVGGYFFAAFFHQRASNKKRSLPAYLAVQKRYDAEMSQLNSTGTVKVVLDATPPVRPPAAMNRKEPLGFPSE